MSSVAVVLGMGLLGLIDDLLGTREITGLKGHISMLLKGKCTTGGLKAIGGGGLAFGFSLVFSSGIVEVLVNTFLIALFTNAVNLTDLRPGRAAKAFLFIGFFLMVSAFFLGSHSILVLGPAFGAVLAFLPYDLKGMVMLGDTGSNVMGIILGIVSVLLLPILVKSIILGMLVLLHIYTEKYSLTETIQNYFSPPDRRMGDFQVISRAVGLVKSITKETKDITQVIVEVAGNDYPAVNFNEITGTVSTGDKVLLNTTAVELNLGTGGSHFVMANLTVPVDSRQIAAEPGHIMKIRYTPNQIKVLSVEEQDSPYHDVMKDFRSLDNTPVVCCSLHSMLPAAAAAVKSYEKNLKVVYVMTDGAALPIGLSRLVKKLKTKGLIDGTVTAGHAFGGDFEAVNIYSGLAAARAVLGADVIIAGMGPGIVGTGTPLGFSGIEQAGIIHAAEALEGRPIAVLRLSFADARKAFWFEPPYPNDTGKAVLIPVYVSLPQIDEKKQNFIIRQMQEAGSHPSTNCTGRWETRTGFWNFIILRLLRGAFSFGGTGILFSCIICRQDCRKDYRHRRKLNFGRKKSTDLRGKHYFF